MEQNGKQEATSPGANKQPEKQVRVSPSQIADEVAKGMLMVSRGFELIALGLFALRDHFSTDEKEMPQQSVGVSGTTESKKETDAVSQQVGTVSGNSLQDAVTDKPAQPTSTQDAGNPGIIDSDRLTAIYKLADRAGVKAVDLARSMFGKHPRNLIASEAEQLEARIKEIGNSPASKELKDIVYELAHQIGRKSNDVCKEVVKKDLKELSIFDAEDVRRFLQGTLKKQPATTTKG